MGSYQLPRSSPRWAARLWRWQRATPPRGFAGRVAIQSTRNRAWRMALRAARLSARVCGPHRDARRSWVRHARFACSVRAPSNRGGISITRGRTSDPRRKPNCNRRGSHRWPGWEGLRHRNHIVPRAEGGAMSPMPKRGGSSVIAEAVGSFVTSEIAGIGLPAEIARHLKDRLHARLSGAMSPQENRGDTRRDKEPRIENNATQ